MFWGQFGFKILAKNTSTCRLKDAGIEYVVWTSLEILTLGVKLCVLFPNWYLKYNQYKFCLMRWQDPDTLVCPKCSAVEAFNVVTWLFEVSDIIWLLTVKKNHFLWTVGDVTEHPLTMFHAAVYHLWNPQWKSSLEWMKFNHLIRKFCFCQVWLWPNIVSWAFLNVILMELVTDGTCWIIYIWAGTISSAVETHCLLVFSHFNKNWKAS